MQPRRTQDIERQAFDLIVIGAGINGAGIARDAAMRGLRVLLLDKGDLSSGTTQWATRLIHGGLRYLEHYEFALVRESLRDREALLHIAPHLVKPLGFLVPIYDRSARGPLMVRLGMTLYDTLSYDKSMDRHKMLNRKKVQEREPGLNTEGLKAAAFYYDAQVEYAERVAVENAVSARDNGATILTYARVDRLILEDGDVKGVEFTDVLEGGSYEVRAPVTVNVAGPWVDEVLADLQVPGTDKNVGRFMGGTKGSHLVVDPFPGAPEGEALYVEARKDGRPYFIVPWNGRYLIGTTDLRYDEDLDYVSASEEEIQYLLDETNYVIPEANLSREDVLFTYSGVRPLPYNPEGETGGVTRSHVVFDHAKGSSAAGGKVKSASAELPQVGGLHLHHRRQADHVPEPEPPDGGRRLQEAGPEGAEEPGPQDAVARRRDVRFRGFRGGLQVRERHTGGAVATGSSSSTASGPPRCWRSPGTTPNSTRRSRPT